MKYLKIIENTANDLNFNGIDFNIILTMLIIGVIVIYLFNYYFGYLLIPDHPHKVSQTLEEYYEHLKEYHPDIWEEYNLTDEGIKELAERVRKEIDKENES